MSQRLLGNIVGFVGMILWASGFPAATEILKTWHPLLVVPPRLALAALVLLVLMAIFEPWPRLDVKRLKDLFLAGSALGISAIMLVWGQKYASPVSVAIIVAAMPPVSAMMGLMSGRESVTLAIGLGIVLAFVGGAVTTLGGGSVTDVGSLGIGELLVAGSIILFVWYTRISVDRLPGVSDLARAGLTLAIAAVVATPITVVAIASGWIEPIYDLAARVIVLLIWLGCIAIGVAMLFWLISSRMLGVTVASMHNNLVPFYVMIFALMAGEPVFMAQFWGAALVVLGAILAQIPYAALRRRPQVRGEP